MFDTAYWIKGNHTFKLGVDLLHNYDLMNNTYESNGDYSYSFIGNYFADVYTKQHGLTNAVALRVRRRRQPTTRQEARPAR